MRSVIKQFLVLCLVGFSWNSALGADATPTKLRVAYSGVGAGTVMIWIAKDAKLFAKYGLEVEEFYIDSPARGGVQSLIGADLFLSSGNVLVSLQAVANGADLVFLGAHGTRENYKFGMASNISEIGELKGKKIGVSGLGGKSDLIARIALRRAGLDPVRDVEMVSIGYSPQRAAALSRNLIQACPLIAPIAFEMKRLGMNVIDLGEIRIVNELLMTTRVFATRQPTALKRFFKAYLSAIHHFLTQRTDSQRIMQEHVTLTEGASLAEMYQTLAAHLEPVPLPNGEAIQALIDATIAMDQKAKTLKASEIFDLRFLDDLQKIGFVETLYSEKIKL